ncbi:hypothetical protein EIP91_010749 [Steccherinum ochraceum]|uniref:Uncharacterized protein n=1 Tax=Steccherinum ochraceum TaxID=92696 RepID=A0A4R0RN41_9APHY|nr:hypothetical protein EIP91_010749 [Steccherinum ochraceum]
MFISKSLLAACALAGVVSATVLPIRRIPFDGQYIHPESSNKAVEWWWGQAIGTPMGNNPPPTLQFLFYQGYPIQVGPKNASQPEYYMDIHGFFPNGTNFALTIPADSGVVTKGSGEEVNGKWGSVGSFHTSKDLRTFAVQFEAAKYGLTGSVTLSSTGNAAHHFGCNTTHGPYFSSAVKGQKSLSTAEDLLFNKLGWATTIPGGNAQVAVKIGDTQLSFTGAGYHDANWAPAPLNKIVSSWSFGSAQVGPYDLSYVLAQPLGSSNPRVLNTGYLSRNGVVLQNQCSVNGTKTKDMSLIKPYGSQMQAGVTVPKGYVIEYVLANGESFSFNLTSSGVNPSQNIYHRWVGTAVGGKKGEKPFEGSTVFEWLNPGLVPYSPVN